MRLFLSILFMLLAADQFANGLRILGIFPLYGRSHWSTGETLLVHLAKRGHQVDVISHFPRKKPIPNYTDISLEGSLPSAINNMNASNITTMAHLNMKLIVNFVGDKCCALLGHPKVQEIIKNPPKDPPYDLVIAELFMTPCFLVFGRLLNVPVISLITASFHDWISDRIGHPHNTAFMPILFSRYGQQMTFFERLSNTVLSNYLTTEINYYVDSQSKYVKEHVGIDVSMKELYKDVSAVLVNSHHSTNGVKWTSPGVIEIGGLHIEEDSEPLVPEVQKWLDESTHGCVFFTFGSMVRIETYSNELIKELYKAFEAIAPVRVLMKIAKKEDLLPGLPKNVMTQSWFPQMSVLKHKNIKAFITHGGLFSSQEAVYFGVPMIGVPLFGDQHVNMANAVARKIAINMGSIGNVTAENLSGAIKIILNDESYRTNVKNLAALFKDRPMKPVDTAIYWVEYVARRGNILQSPAMHLEWWQQNLLDVYGFILACLLAVLYVTVFILRKLVRLLTGSKSCSKKAKASHSKKVK